jgi:hypothetical protein
MDKGPQDSSRTSPETQSPKPERKGRWRWILVAVAAVGTVVGGVATFEGDLEKLKDVPNQIVILWNYLFPGDDFSLRDVRMVSSQHISSTDQSVTVEAVASKHDLKNCAADLDIGLGKSYPKSLDVTEKRDARNGFKRFLFTIPDKDFPDHASIHLRCERAVSQWTTVAWPVDEKLVNFGVVRGQDNSHGGPSIGCTTDLVGWAKLNHPDVCKFVKPIQTDVADGAGCGFTHFTIQCSNVPFDQAR